MSCVVMLAEWCASCRGSLTRTIIRGAPTKSDVENAIALMHTIVASLRDNRLLAKMPDTFSALCCKDCREKDFSSKDFWNNWLSHFIVTINTLEKKKISLNPCDNNPQHCERYWKQQLNAALDNSSTILLNALRNIDDGKENQLLCHHALLLKRIRASTRLVLPAHADCFFRPLLNMYVLGSFPFWTMAQLQGIGYSETDVELFSMESLYFSKNNGNVCAIISKMFLTRIGVVPARNQNEHENKFSALFFFLSRENETGGSKADVQLPLPLVPPEDCALPLKEWLNFVSQQMSEMSKSIKTNQNASSSAFFSPSAKAYEAAALPEGSSESEAEEGKFLFKMTYATLLSFLFSPHAIRR